MDTTRFFCPFLLRGYCREASRCKFSHDLSDSVKIPNDFCHFYLANKCLYGPDCKFKHSIPDISSQRGNLDILTQPIITNRNGYYERGQPSFIANDQEEFVTDEIFYETAETQPLPFGELSRGVSVSMPSLSTTYTQLEPTTYANISGSEIALNQINDARETDLPLCPYTDPDGVCQLPEGQCTFIHCIKCDLCNNVCMHPYDRVQQQKHRDECLQEHEREMELSFAVQRSKDKVCGICMEVVTEKKPVTSSRFGILDKCNHIFCVSCIRLWRGNRALEARTIRSCPQCRVSSDFVVPSKYWIEDKDDKAKLIHDYKAALKTKPCKYFNEGAGECPFGSSCFYKHAYPDGRLATSEGPPRRRRSHAPRAATSEFNNFILWNILTTDDDDWSNDELESLYIDRDYGTPDEDDPETIPHSNQVDDEDSIPDTDTLPYYDEDW